MAKESQIEKEALNSPSARGVIFRFDRRAIEIRVMDEKECIKSVVAISCFIRALLLGVLDKNAKLLPHEVLVKDFNSVVANGLNAQTEHPSGGTARKVCQSFFGTAWKNASHEERKYLPIIKKRIDRGSLSNIIRERVERKAQKTEFKEAIVSIYSRLAESLMDNQPYF